MKLKPYQRLILRVAVAVVVVALGASLRLWPLQALGTRLAYLTFYPAVMVAALYGGLFTGLLATAFSLLVVCSWQPAGRPFIQDSADWLGMAVFAVNGLMISLVCQAMHNARAKMANALAQAKRFSLAMDHIPAFIYIKDHRRRYVYANRPTLELFHCTPGELAGSDDSRFFPPDTAARLYAIDTRVLEHREDTAEEVISKMADGTRHVYWEVKAPIYDDADKDRVWGLCGIFTDITERKQQEAALLESEERFRSTFDAAAIGMALVSLEGRFIQANDALCRLVGYEQDELRQKTFQDITHPEDLEADLALMGELVIGIRESYQMEKRYFHKDGHVIWILLNGSAVRHAAGNVLYFIAQIQDISERKALLERLELQAHQDHLTGLSNRRFFLERGEAELARVRRYHTTLSLFMLDIDHFKDINDTYGHKVGDIVLQKLSDTLRKTLREVDIIGRMGGEEFAVLLPETGAREAADTAERLRKAIARGAVVLDAGLPLHFSVSIGVATLEENDANVDILLSLADKALYQAKRAGRDRVCLAA